MQAKQIDFVHLLFAKGLWFCALHFNLSLIIIYLSLSFSLRSRTFVEKK